MRFKRPVAAAFLALLIPSTALANAGTPLMWAAMAHLLIGNALIGAFEGGLLCFLFKTPAAKSVWTLVLANYVSAWAGGVLLTSYLATLPDITLATLHLWFWLFVFLAFLVTLVLEFPFFWSLLRKQEQALRKTLKATLLVNLASYVLLFGWYWWVSGTSLLTGLQITPVAEMQPPPGYALFFISPDGTQALRSDLDGKHTETLQALPIAKDNDRLFARKNQRNGFDLWLHQDAARQMDEKDVLLLADFAPLAPVDLRLTRDPDQKPSGTGMNFGEVPSLAARTDWACYTGFWSVEGIRGKNEKLGAGFHFTLETPFIAWSVRNAVLLDGDFLLFQLGQDQICLLQPQRRQIALIARGKGPLVVRPGLPSPATAAPQP